MAAFGRISQERSRNKNSQTVCDWFRPEAWTTFNTKSLLGGALAGQKTYADAEPLLLAGYEGMKQREKTISPESKARLAEALERLVELHEATEKPDEAAKWCTELEARKSAGKPAEKKP